MLQPRLPHPIQRLIDFYRDPEYFKNLRRLAMPIIAQQFMFSALNMAGVVFVGQKGDALLGWQIKWRSSSILCILGS